MMWKKLGIGIMCAVMACGVLAGCGGGGSADNGLGKVVSTSGKAIKFGDKEGKILRLETPTEVPSLQKSSNNIVWYKDAIFATSYTADGAMKYTIQDKKIVVSKDKVEAKNLSAFEGTDGTRLYYRTKDNPTGHGAINAGKDEGVIESKTGGYFTVMPSGKQGFIWFNNKVVYPVKLDNGKVTSVDQTNWLKGEMGGPVGVVTNGEAIFMEGVFKLDGKNHRCIYEYKLDGSLVRQYGEKNEKEPGGLRSPSGWTVTKDYVVVYDGGNQLLDLYKRADGSFVGAVKSSDLDLKVSIENMTPISDNLVLVYGHGDYSQFALIQL
jgi:hypothetical protein